MTQMRRLLNEPVLIGGAIRSILLAVMAFGFPMTAEQVASVMLAVEAVLALLTRALVTPNQLATARVAQGLSPTDSRSDNQPPGSIPGQVVALMRRAAAEGRDLTDDERDTVVKAFYEAYLCR